MVMAMESQRPNNLLSSFEVSSILNEQTTYGTTVT
jgi:hypothetical protein